MTFFPLNVSVIQKKFTWEYFSSHLSHEQWEGHEPRSFSGATRCDSHISVSSTAQASSPREASRQARPCVQRKTHRALPRRTYPEAENAGILVGEALVPQDLLQMLFVLCQGAQRCQEPAISCEGTQPRVKGPGHTWKPHAGHFTGLCDQRPHMAF